MPGTKGGGGEVGVHAPPYPEGAPCRPIVGTQAAAASTTLSTAPSAADGGGLGLDGARQRRLARLQRLAHSWDKQFQVPVLHWRFGWDAIIGLVPFVGDAAGVAVGSYLVSRALVYHLPRSLVLRMSLNVLVDGTLGLVPLVGDVFDTSFKANSRNIKLLEAHLRCPEQAHRADRGCLCCAAVCVVLVPLLLLAILAVGLTLLILALTRGL